MFMPASSWHWGQTWQRPVYRWGTPGFMWKIPFCALTWDVSCAVLYECKRPCLHANNHSGNWQKGLGELRLACWQRLFGTADSKAYCSPSLFLPASFRSERDGWDWGNTLLLALTCCRLCMKVRGQGFLPSTTMFKLLHCTTLEAGRENTWKKEKSSKLFGKDIKNTLRCQLQFPRVVQDIVRDREPGLVLVVVQ